jgi:Bacterial archaeo-eukaryotic release factor family 3
MDSVRIEDLVALGSRRQGPCISIFMPVRQMGDRTQEMIRFKNHIREAEEQLRSVRSPAGEIRELLEPLRKLTDDHFFWQYQSSGLAVYRSSDHFHTFRLPVSFEDLVVVTDRFQVKPLLRVATGEDRFYVLALSQKSVRLLHCNRFTQSAVELPREAREVMAAQEDMPEPQLQAHSAGSGPQAVRMMHGNPAGAETDKHRMLKRFRRLEHTLHGVLAGETAPMVLASVDYLLPIYREANSYPSLQPAGIPGNPEQLRDDELREAGWAVLEPQVRARREEVARDFHNLKPAGRATSDLAQVVKASADGRVSSLLVALGAQVWGRFDSTTRQLDVHEQAQPGDEDLVDLAAIQTLERSGTVIAVPSEAVPDGSPAAATFRY